jgi:hypothetical protein
MSRREMLRINKGKSEMVGRPSMDQNRSKSDRGHPGRSSKDESRVIMETRATYWLMWIIKVTNYMQPVIDTHIRK